jgi:pimeloyl-ACP methyl ester carboxylesterase/DNA-binding CsgD family transcriptional regulator
LKPAPATLPASASEAADLLRAAWAEDATANPELDGLLLRASAPDFEGAAALIPDEAVAAAVLTTSGAAAGADARFAAAFPDVEGRADIRRLADQARRAGQAMGVLAAAERATLAAWAVTGERAQAWARCPAQAAALARPGAVLLLTFAPTRSNALSHAATEAFGLTPLEARIAEAFLFAPTLEIAAEQAGVGRETARDAMARVVAKTGARRSASVVRRLTELISAVRDQGPLTPEVLVQAFGLTRSEAEVAVRLVAGATQREAAKALGLRPETVRGYAKAALQKSGATRVKDLARVAAEAQSLDRFRDVAEPVFVRGGPPAQLRLMPRGGGRNVAFLDYGPRSGEPAIVFHGFMAGRSLPPALVRGLQQRDCRPIVVQRPGFGLTSQVRAGYLEACARDLADVIDSLGLTRISLFARDGGTAAALAFASRHPDRIARAALLNPRSPHGLSGGQRSGPVAQLTRLILARPQAIGPLGEFIRKRTRSDVLEKLLRETLKALPQDLAALDDPAIKAQLVRDIQAQFAHSAAGYVAEHALYAEGWTPPPVPGGGPWTIIHAGGLSTPPPRAPWEGLTGVRFVELPGAGVLAQFTHAEALAGLIAGR